MLYFTVLDRSLILQGNNILLFRSCFLATPKTQFKNMTHKTRIVLSILYLGAIVLTLVLGILLPENLSFLVFVSLAGQMVAYFFYTLSYIPYGRKILKKICKFMIKEWIMLYLNCIYQVNLKKKYLTNWHFAVLLVNINCLSLKLMK